jgi:hypothetical protein
LEVSEAKHVLSDRTKIPAKDLQLIDEREEVEDDMTIEDYDMPAALR